jgi:hypothetical protein
MDEQMPLIEAESDEALLLPREELRKRYTAGQAEKVEWRRDCIVAMLGGGVFTIEQICAAAHANERVVKQIAQMHAAKIAQDLQRCGERFISDAAMTFELAKDKREKAPYRDLMVGGGILATNGLAMKMAGAASGADANPAIEVETVNGKAEEARKWLADRKPKEVENGDTLKRGLQTDTLKGGQQA